jgi:hypothetical protein
LDDVRHHHGDAIALDAFQVVDEEVGELLAERIQFPITDGLAEIRERGPMTETIEAGFKQRYDGWKFVQIDLGWNAFGIAVQPWPIIAA